MKINHLTPKWVSDLNFKGSPYSVTCNNLIIFRRPPCCLAPTEC